MGEAVPPHVVEGYKDQPPHDIGEDDDFIGADPGIEVGGTESLTPSQIIEMLTEQRDDALETSREAIRLLNESFLGFMYYSTSAKAQEVSDFLSKFGY